MDQNKLQKIQEKDEAKKLQDYNERIKPHFAAIQKLVGDMDLKYFDRKTEEDFIIMNAEISDKIIRYGVENSLNQQDIEYILARIIQAFGQGFKKVSNHFDFFKEDILANTFKMSFKKVPLNAIDEVLKKLDNSKN